MNGEWQIAVLSDRGASNCFESPNFLQILVESLNKRGFKIVEYYNSRHPDPRDTEESDASDSGMFRFEKDMLCTGNRLHVRARVLRLSRLFLPQLLLHAGKQVT